LQSQDQQSVEENGDPVDSSGIGGVAGVAGTYGEMAEVGIFQNIRSCGRQDAGGALGIGDDFAVGVGGGDHSGVGTIFFGEGAGGLVEMRRRERREGRQAGAYTHFVEGLAYAAGGLARGVRWHGVAEILHDVEAAMAPDGNDAGYVEARVENVLAMGRRVHEQVMGVVGAAYVGDVFSGAVEGKGTHVGNSLKQGGLARKLMFELPRSNHAAGMEAGSLAQAFFHPHWRYAGLLSALIHRFEEGCFGGGVFITRRRA
jgi:hypothetical protein